MLKDVVVTVERIKVTSEILCDLGKAFDVRCVVKNEPDCDEAFALPPEVAVEQVHGFQVRMGRTRNCELVVQLTRQFGGSRANRLKALQE
jgi:hypothetical protein